VNKSKKGVRGERGGWVERRKNRVTLYHYRMGLKEGGTVKIRERRILNVYGDSEENRNEVGACDSNLP